MSTPNYKYPDFVKNVSLKTEDGKRYWLTLKIDNDKTDCINVILKNPSRADENISDKTVYTVATYIYNNRKKHSAFNNIGEITILNLIPNYLTDSNRLQNFKDDIIDQENMLILNRFCSQNKKVIIAWGNHPEGLYKEFEELKQSAMKILSENANEVFFVDRMTNDGNPKHGQVWGYNDELKRQE